jgi:hypothetical protein
MTAKEFPKKRDKFTQLVNDLLKGDLTPLLLILAYKEYLRRRKDLPEEIKSLLVGNDTLTTPINKMWSAIQMYVGNVELAYRRGSQEIKRNQKGKIKRNKK